MLDSPPPIASPKQNALENVSNQPVAPIAIQAISDTTGLCGIFATLRWPWRVPWRAAEEHALAFRMVEKMLQNARREFLMLARRIEVFYVWVFTYFLSLLTSRGSHKPNVFTWLFCMAEVAAEEVALVFRMLGKMLQYSRRESFIMRTT